MKQYLLCLAATFFSIGISRAQVEVDKSIALTGGSGNSTITGLVDAPVNGTDAVNKDYVDAAVSAGGGGSVPWLHWQVFNTGGTFTVPSGVTMIKVQVSGAGGGGGSGGFSGARIHGGGGGAGGFAEGTYEVTPGDSYAVTIGTGGAGATAGSDNSGLPGSASSFVGTGVNIAASGGAGGYCGRCNPFGVGGDGGWGSGGYLNTTLGAGGSGGNGSTIAGQPGGNAAGRGGTYNGGGGGGGVGGGYGGNYDPNFAQSGPGGAGAPNSGGGGGGGAFDRGAGGAGGSGRVVVFW